jgi:mono/diheme cytochrome c family protein
LTRSLNLNTICFLLFIFIGLGCSNQKSFQQPTNKIDNLESPVPAEYVNKINPLSNTIQTVENGKGYFQKYCVTCHGDFGEGNGPASAALDPKPKNLKEAQNMFSDGYLFWRISEGGTMEPFKSSMPPWKSVLDEDEIWEIIVYIRSLSK